MDYSKYSDEQLDQMVAEKIAMRVPPTEPSGNHVDYAGLSDEQLDQMVAEKLQSSQSQSRPGEAALQGFGNAATFGYLPQIQAGVEKGVDYLFGDNVDEKLKEQGFQLPKEKSYVETRDEYIERDNSLQESNPAAYIAGGVGGGIASGIATGGLFGAGAKTATMGQRFAQAAKTGAAVGLVRNPGDTEGEVDPVQAKERAENALWDSITGVALQGGAETVSKIGKTIKNTGKQLKNWSQQKAFRAAGAEKTDFKKAILNKKSAELGQAVLENKLINPGDSAKDIAVNAEKAMKQSQTRLNKIYDTVDDKTAYNIRKEDIKQIQDRYMSEASERLSGTVDGEKIAEKLQDVLETMPTKGNFKEMRKWRSSIDDQINFAKANQDLPKFQEELMHLRNKVQEGVAETIGRSNPELRKSFLKENKNIHHLSEIQRIASVKSAAIEGNTSFGIREGFGAGVGGMIGTSLAGPMGTVPGAALGAITANTARKYATPAIALYVNRAARVLENNKQLLGKFSDPLIAASSNPKEFAAAVTLMMKEPEFKKKIQNINLNDYQDRSIANDKKGNK